MEEPCLKKQRFDSPETVFELKAILPDDLHNPIPLEVVVVSRIDSKKSILNIISTLKDSLSLPSLQHLKRVRQNEIILCKGSDVELTTTTNTLDENDVFRIKQYISDQGVPVDMANALCAHTTLVEVASMPVKLRWQYEIANQLWPCKFHPNKYLESLFNGTCFKKGEVAFHSQIASIVRRLSDLENNAIGVCVDPRTNSIVAIASGMTNRSPIMHCPMGLVDFVARSQSGGAWTYNEEVFHESDDEGLNFCGIPERFYNTILNTFKENVSFGAKNIILKEEGKDMQSCNNLDKHGPYLCTGYDVYVLVEPCLMCSMALLHSRVRRIFYLVPSENGALRTKIKLHTVKEVNHHFEVFQCYDGIKKDFNKCGE